MCRSSGDLKASFQYQREIKSGFIYLCDQSDSDCEDEAGRGDAERMQVDQTGATSELSGRGEPPLPQPALSANPSPSADGPPQQQARRNPGGGRATTPHMGRGQPSKSKLSGLLSIV